MSPDYRKKLVLAIGILILIGGGSLALMWGRSEYRKPNTPNPTPPESTATASSTAQIPHTYTDTALHFSIEPPSKVTDIQKIGQATTFKTSADGPRIISIFAESTPYNTTKDWLKAQSEGSASSRGYEFIRWIGSQIDEKVLVTEYVGPGNDSIYEKRFRMIAVKNKSLYTVDMGIWHKADAEATIDPDIEHALETFQATGLVTTDSTGSYKTIENRECGATFHIPPDWSNYSMFGESKILSPEDEHENEEWNNANQELIQNAEGDVIGLDARSLYIACQSKDVESYINDLSSDSTKYKDFVDNATLSDVFSSEAFHSADSNLALIKTRQIDGKSAYEISKTNKTREGVYATNYKIILEGKKVMEIELGRTEYDDLSNTVKQIIQSISFEE